MSESVMFNNKTFSYPDSESTTTLGNVVVKSINAYKDANGTPQNLTIMSCQGSVNVEAAGGVNIYTNGSNGSLFNFFSVSKKMT